MQPNNLTALDFEDIKASIKTYLRTRTEFSDYDFDGSTLSYLIDMLAYNTYYTSFTANMSVNEAFLPSATIRDNVVAITKLLNYVPTSITASRAALKLVIQTSITNGVYPSTVTLKKGPVATGGGFTWNTLSDRTVAVNATNGKATFSDVCAFQGSLVTYSYVVNTFSDQKYIIPTANADISTLKVRVRANESATSADLYSRVQNITELSATDRIYFIHEGEDMRYEIRFGDDAVGRKLTDGEIVELEYLVTSGPDANEVDGFEYIGTSVNSNDQSIISSNVALTVEQKSALGSGAESVESIKYNAPRYLATQDRAVTAQDYAIITKKIYNNVDSVVAYGGDVLNPPVYGKVYVAIKTKTGSDLNDQTKKDLSNQLRRYAMASIDPVITDADNMYIYPKLFVQYDPGAGSSTSQIQSDLQKALTQWATQTQINNFNTVFKSQDMKKALQLSNKAVSDVSDQVSILKYVLADSNTTNTYCISVGNPLYDSNPSNDGTKNCNKEPILLSGTFRTADRPGIDQQFEDDGFGNLMTFYNTGSKKVYTNKQAGSVNYNTGKICFGPINIVGSGPNVPSEDNIDRTGTDGTGTGGDGTGTGGDGTGDGTGAGTDGLGNVIDTDLLPNEFKIPVMFIPATITNIPAATPGTIVNIVNPDITVAPIGSTPPPSIPLNSLTPGDFDDIPSTIDIDPIDINGTPNTSACF